MPGEASEGSLAVSSDDLSSSERSGPGAFGEGGETSLVDNAVLALSVVLSDDLGTSEVESWESESSTDFAESTAEEVSSVSLLNKSASLSVSGVRSDDSGSGVPPGGLGELAISSFPDSVVLSFLEVRSGSNGSSHVTSPSALDE